MRDHVLNFSCLLVTYSNTKISATETNLFSKRLIKEHTCRVNGGELGHLAEKNNFMHMTTAVKRFRTGAVIIICSRDRVCVTYWSLNRTCICPQLPETIPVTWFTWSKCTNPVGNPLNKTYSVYLGTQNGNKIVCSCGAGKKIITNKKKAPILVTIFLVCTRSSTVTHAQEIPFPDPLHIQSETKLKT